MVVVVIELSRYVAIIFEKKKKKKKHNKSESVAESISR